MQSIFNFTCRLEPNSLGRPGKYTAYAVHSHTENYSGLVDLVFTITSKCYLQLQYTRNKKKTSVMRSQTIQKASQTTENKIA